MEEPKAHALVTGGAGFIGSHLCDSLLKEGYRVTCLDSLITGDYGNIAAALGNPLFTFEEGDVNRLKEGDADFIFHLASPASPVDYLDMPVETMLANSVGTLNCLELARRCGARLLMSSTSEVYGDPLVSPQSEAYFGNVNPVGPRSCYDEGKRFAEALCKAYERRRGAEVVIVRIFNTYGTRMRKDDGRVVPNFVCQALEGRPITIYGSGGQTRSFCHVSDMVKGLLLAMFTPAAAGEVINIGNPGEMTVLELANMVIDRTGSGSKLEYRPLPDDDPARRRPDIDRAREVLGWEPEVGLEAGLGEVIEWFRERV